MPDVRIYDRRLRPALPDYVTWALVIPEIVAEQMTCMDDDGKTNEVTPEQIDLTIFQAGTHALMDKDGRVLVEITGYGFQDRMDNIDWRIMKIAIALKELFGDATSVAVTFIPIPEKCWVKF